MLIQGCTIFYFIINNVLKAVYGLKDDPRPNALETVKVLQGMILQYTYLLAATIELCRLWHPSLTTLCLLEAHPLTKDHIQKLLGTTVDCKQPALLFCGDGTNDAVALAQATIGIHMNEGTGVTQPAADVGLMRPSLGSILTMMDVSRRSVNRIKFNSMRSFVYNTFVTFLSKGFFVNARISTECTGLGSVLPVIAAAVSLRWPAI